MKEHKNISITRPRTTPAAVPSSVEFPDWLVQKINACDGGPSSKYMTPPPNHCMMLTDESGQRFMNPPWRIVENVIRSLDPGKSNSFACLESPGNCYVQCLRGFNGWHVEIRLTEPSGVYQQYRACYAGGSKKSFELKKHDFISEGQYRDLLTLESVLISFQSFQEEQVLASSLKWRLIDI